MKSLIISAVAFATITLSACNGNKNQSKANNPDSTNTQPTAATDSGAMNDNPTHAIVASYLDLKNSLAEDNGSDAAKGGQEILDALSKFDVSSLNTEQKKVFTELVGDIKENSEHIHENGSDIAHQREHFEMLSKDMTDLVKATGTNQTMYLDSCPMYDEGKGTWLSEIKEIKNPYMGKKSPTCGAIKETVQ